MDPLPEQPANQSVTDPAGTDFSLAQLHSNRGIELREQGRFPEALAEGYRGVELDPLLHSAHNNLGVVLTEMGRFDLAERAYRRAISLRPDYPSAHLNLGLILLRNGQWGQGWAEYEWRCCLPATAPTLQCDKPCWRGEDARGRTILLHADQGYGDAIQFIHFAPPLAARGMKVVMLCGRKIPDLLRTVPGVQQVLSAPSGNIHFDYHCPLLSLPYALGLTLDAVPQNVPYIHPHPRRIEHWRGQLAATARLKVGLAWAGNPRHVNDRNRSMHVSTLAPLADVPGVTFYSLQKDRPAGQETSPPPGMGLIDFTDGFHDFTEAAAMIANLDLVITVDTAIAHLAGALGRPVWTLLPFVADWRWLLHRADSPWYPTMRLFRQDRPRQWAGVVGRVSEELSRLVYRPCLLPPARETPNPAK